jgi:hypothetical protein
LENMVEVEIEVEVEVEVEVEDMMMIWFPVVDKCVDLSPCSFWLQATG